MENLLVGISACLTGLKVRYDGGDKFDPFIIENIDGYLEAIPFCPEVESGLLVPREPMTLKNGPDGPRIVTIHSNVDHTEIILNWAKIKIKELEERGICGFIFKCGSPSCGLEVDIPDESKTVTNKGIGLFAGMCLGHFQDMPFEEEKNLRSLHRINNFIQRVYAYSYKRKILKDKKGLT